MKRHPHNFLKAAVISYLFAVSFCLTAPNATAAEQGTQVCVLGAVARPGICGQEHPDGPGLMIAKAIELCGGATAGADLHRVRVARIDSNESYELDLLKPIPERGSLARQILLSGDVLFVPYADGAKSVGWADLCRPGQVAVFGSVIDSGFVKVAPGDTVLSLLTKAGGIRLSHDVEQVVIAHVSSTGISPVKTIYGAEDSALSQLQVRVGDVVYVKGTEPYHGPMNDL